MSKPQLLVIAGCNGSGKSTYSKSLSPNDTLPFDYDKHFLDIYNAKSDSELRERMAHHQALIFWNNPLKVLSITNGVFVMKQILIQLLCIGPKNLEVMAMKLI